MGLVTTERGRKTPSHAWLGITGAMVIALFAVLSCKPTGDKAPSVPSSPTVVTGSQAGLWDRFPASCRVVGLIGSQCLDPYTLDERELMRCAREDGNPDGSPCIWLNGNGELFYVDSSEYRR